MRLGKHGERDVAIAFYRPPAFCEHCGTPFPWTAAKLVAGRELADDLLELTIEERDQLKGSIHDLVSAPHDREGRSPYQAVHQEAAGRGRRRPSSFRSGRRLGCGERRC